MSRPPCPISMTLPLVIDDYVKNQGGSVQDQYDAVQRVISGYNLLKIHPSVRVAVAEQVLDKAISLAKQTWPNLVGVIPAALPFYRAPEVNRL